MKTKQVPKESIGFLPLQGGAICALMPAQSTFGIIRLVLIFLVYVPMVSCTAFTLDGSKPKRFDTFQSQFDRVTQAGEVVLHDGTRFRLAGIQMRSVEETQEPELLGVVNDIISRESQCVRIEHHMESDTVAVYYTQAVSITPVYILPIAWLRSMMKPTTTGTVNELLILMATAKYDPSVGQMTKDATRRCEVANDKTHLALRTSYRYRLLAEYKSCSGQLYTDRDGYRPRITKGDVPQRDANLARLLSSPKPPPAEERRHGNP
jgi:hypothetical protein